MKFWTSNLQSIHLPCRFRWVLTQKTIITQRIGWWSCIKVVSLCLSFRSTTKYMHEKHPDLVQKPLNISDSLCYSQSQGWRFLPCFSKASLSYSEPFSLSIAPMRYFTRLLTKTKKQCSAAISLQSKRLHRTPTACWGSWHLAHCPAKEWPALLLCHCYITSMKRLLCERISHRRDSEVAWVGCVTAIKDLNAERGGQVNTKR